MSRKTSHKTGKTASDSIRGVFAGQPKATVAEVQAALKKQGVEASVALIRKLKYNDTKGQSKKRPRGRAAAAAHGAKAQAIRETWGRLGRKSRVRDVVHDLKSRGIEASAAQVSNLRNSKARGRVAAVAIAVQEIPFTHLLAASELVRQLGSVDLARKALDDLAKLTTK